MILPLSLGLTHGVADCISGYMIGSLTGHLAEGMIMTLILVYNVLAFGGQTPFGLLLDRIGGVKTAALISAGMIGAGLVLFQFSPVAGIILAGIGSAGFHVAGGAATLRSDQGNATGPGIFAAPGVMGLMAGGWLSSTGFSAWWLMLAAMVAMTFILGNLAFPKLQSPEEKSVDHGFEMHDLIMILLLLAIAFRSAVWNVMNLIHYGEAEFLLVIGAAALAGKVIGGFAADRIGWRNYILGSLALAIPALSFGGEIKWLMVPGIALLQSATPVAIAAMHKAMPRSPATAAGVSLGLGIAIGGIPLYAGLSPGILSSPWLLAGMGGIALIAYVLALGRKKGLRVKTRSG